MLLTLNFGFHRFNIFKLKKSVFKVNYLMYVGFEERTFTYIHELNNQKVEEF
jgi:hypothetical protein